MTRYSALPMLLSCGLLCGLPSRLPAQLHSVDEAMLASRTTGRPIFALAGDKT
jgi:hypothetical protein